jgi:hypothetical protein
VIKLIEGQRYTFLPESRGEVKQNMELHGFTRPGSRDMLLLGGIDGGAWYAISF